MFSAPGGAGGSPGTAPAPKDAVTCPAPALLKGGGGSIPLAHTSDADCTGLLLANSQIPGSRACLITLLSPLD